MANEEQSISELSSNATLADVIEKINQIIIDINHMWHPEDE
tara:strand:- start:77 stop:199 length:123 start_codon:yes stop_codon:yes gene_type:complete